jgi:hypothetical protein
MATPRPVMTAPPPERLLPFSSCMLLAVA